MEVHGNFSQNLFFISPFVVDVLDSFSRFSYLVKSNWNQRRWTAEFSTPETNFLLHFITRRVAELINRTKISVAPQG